MLCSGLAVCPQACWEDVVTYGQEIEEATILSSKQQSVMRMREQLSDEGLGAVMKAKPAAYNEPPSDI